MVTNVFLGVNHAQHKEAGPLRFQIFEDQGGPK